MELEKLLQQCAQVHSDEGNESTWLQSYKAANETRSPQETIWPQTINHCNTLDLQSDVNRNSRNFMLQNKCVQSNLTEEMLKQTDYDFPQYSAGVMSHSKFAYAVGQQLAGISIVIHLYMTIIPLKDFKNDIIIELDHDLYSKIDLAREQEVSTNTGMKIAEKNSFNTKSNNSISPRNSSNSDSPASLQVDQRRHKRSIDGYIYKIQFKRMHRYFDISDTAPRNIQVGDFVKVEADRGEDLGLVCAKIPCHEFKELKPTAGFRGRGAAAIQEEHKRIIGFATEEEKKKLPQKLAEEKSALGVCREKVLRRDYPMDIRDAEYQFDHHKLTFYYEADRRIDFRDLISDLFALYKTRIWMQQIDTSFVPDVSASRALYTGIYDGPKPCMDNHGSDDKCLLQSRYFAPLRQNLAPTPPTSPFEDSNYMFTSFFQPLNQNIYQLSDEEEKMFDNECLNKHNNSPCDEGSFGSEFFATYS